MSERQYHSGGGQIDTEEHLAGENQVNRKAVGLFAKDAYGDGTFELSALSTASGAVLSVTPANVSANIALGNVTLNPGPNHIGSVTIFGTVQSTPGMTTLFGGPNQIGSVTVSNQLDIRSILSVPTLNVVTQAITVNSGMVTIFPGPNQIGSVTVANTVPVTGTFFQATQPVSFNLVSLASGTEVRSLTTVLNFPATQPVSFGLVSLASGTEVRSLTTVLNFPASQAVTGTFWQATQPVSFGLVSLASGTEVRALATVLNFPATQAISGNVGVTGLISLASGTEVRSLATILNFPATQPVSFGLVSLASGTEVRSLTTILNSLDIRSVLSFPTINVVTQAITVNSGMVTLFPGPNQIGSVTVSNFVAPNLGNVTLNSSSAHIGSVSVFGNLSASLGGNVTLNPGPNQIGSVTVSNFPATQPVSFGLVSLASGTEVRALATVLNFPATQAVSFNQLVSLASGTEVRSLATILNFPATQPVSFGLVSLASGTEIRALATVMNFPATQAVSQSGTWNVGVTGLVSLASGTEIRSLATLLNQPPLVASTAFIGLVSVQGNVAVSNFVAPNLGNVTLNSGPNYIGLVTNTLARGMTTSFATIFSGVGNYTIFVPPGGQRFFLHNVMVNAMGVSEGNLKSGTKPFWPWAGLATYGGFAKTFDNPGIRGGAVDDALVVTLNSAATISFDTTVHFE